MIEVIQSMRERLLQTNSPSLNHSGVSGERLTSRLIEIAKIGLTVEGGSHRLGYSSEEAQAKGLVKKWINEMGLEVRMDGAGNIIGRLEGKKGLPAIACGSHIDSVPNGGHFDGVLGVLAALEVLEAWKYIGFQPTVPVEVIVFADEEGTRFNTGYIGSSAMTGKAEWNFLSRLTDQEDYRFADIARVAGITQESFTNAARSADELSAYIEVHIEQGTQLERNEQPVGIVTGIAGSSNLELKFIGMAAHAGNTPMKGRRDALVAASHFISTLPELALSVSDTAVATVGQLHVYPNGSNVVPGEVRLSVDLRDIYSNSIQRLMEKVKSRATDIERLFNVQVEWTDTLQIAPTLMDQTLIELQEKTIKKNGMIPVHLPSGAGHDAMVMGRHIPTAMFFTRSLGGISHHPAEWSDLSDCMQTVHVLKGFLERLSSDLAERGNI
ncbi:Zn-dependent hydrolase [Sporosarcina sp. P33]|uniref:Zn-dependent hydrolase n=1 Tax=Sporosarcina sp. P33 TaxID=1930764 RepID=UPI0009C194A1|nr:Zn-dependent hydrolase [Sporosarcina sp. P33]ARD49021.1 Zn-dependent hydrolase [Sporosarcina sp. P33]